MKIKTTRVVYWVITILFALLMLMDGFGGVTRQQAGVEVMQHLGYPIYALSIFGIAKILGALAIVQNKFKTIKEWAYAGFTFNFIGAMLSRAYSGDQTSWILFPLIPLAVLFLSYYFWKKYCALPAAKKF
ncbi:MAG: DoxX family protein [Chitinophagaceae bacterium]